MRFAPQPGVPVPVPMHRQWLGIVGSAGQPRDRDVRAMYALFDERAATVTFHRVPYDHAGAAAAIRATPLPAFFADRLESGR
jgi:diadenosine tetraphosphatase ApaH/serine/threonine PP2A family protein phosphatase